MNDDDLTELILRASAYLDGELDAAERALAEADPAVMAEVEALRSLQDEVRNVPSPASGVREAAIAAALAEFDALQPVPDRVVPFRPRPSYSRWLTAAAAVVAVGLVGVVVAQSNRGGDDEDSAAIEADLAEAPNAERSDTAAAAADAELQSSVTESDVFAAEMATDEADDDMGTGAVTEAPEAVATDTVGPVAEQDEAPPATDNTTLSTVAPSEVPPTTAPRTLDEPVTEDSLFAVGRDLLAQYEAGTLGVTPETACEFGSYVILARVGFVVGDDEREAIIAADPDFPEVGAFDAATCQEFAIVTGE